MSGNDIITRNGRALTWVVAGLAVLGLGVVLLTLRVLWWLAAPLLVIGLIGFIIGLATRGPHGEGPATPAPPA